MKYEVGDVVWALGSPSYDYRQQMELFTIREAQDGGYYCLISPERWGLIHRHASEIELIAPRSQFASDNDYQTFMAVTSKLGLRPSVISDDPASIYNDHRD